MTVFDVIEIMEKRNMKNTITKIFHKSTKSNFIVEVISIFNITKTLASDLWKYINENLFLFPVFDWNTFQTFIPSHKLTKKELNEIKLDSF